ncbi:MAG: hypothetical protein R3D34_15070 [Nitratireductor sp.]
MSKGQQRSNKEARKPKQDKKPAASEASFSLQMKNAGAPAGGGATGGKGKK